MMRMARQARVIDPLDGGVSFAEAQFTSGDGARLAALLEGAGTIETEETAHLSFAGQFELDLLAGSALVLPSLPQLDGVSPIEFELLRGEAHLRTTVSYAGKGRDEKRAKAEATEPRYPMAVLVSSGSASASEMFASGMQELGRVRVFGSRTAGASLPAQTLSLPNGDGLIYPTSLHVTESGKMIEGNGVTPDVEVALTREDLLAGRDRTLEVAIDWIHEQETTNSLEARAR